MEDKIKHLEMVTKRLARRSRKKTVALITPYPISNAVLGDEVKGIVLRYMFPCGGTITKGVIDLGKKPKQEVAITFALMGDETGTSNVFVLTKKRLVIKPDIKASAFDRLTISISYKAEKPEDAVTEFWTSFLWVPTVKDVEVKSYLIDELENDLLEE